MLGGRETLQYAIGMYVRGEGDTAVCHRYVGGRETLQYAIGMLGGGRHCSMP